MISFEILYVVDSSQAWMDSRMELKQGWSRRLVYYTVPIQFFILYLLCIYYTNLRGCIRTELVYALFDCEQILPFVVSGLVCDFNWQYLDIK